MVAFEEEITKIKNDIEEEEANIENVMESSAEQKAAYEACKLEQDTINKGVDTFRANKEVVERKYHQIEEGRKDFEEKIEYYEKCSVDIQPKINAKQEAIQKQEADLEVNNLCFNNLIFHRKIIAVCPGQIS